MGKRRAKGTDEKKRKILAARKKLRKGEITPKARARRPAREKNAEKRGKRKGKRRTISRRGRRKRWTSGAKDPNSLHPVGDTEERRRKKNNGTSQGEGIQRHKSFRERNRKTPPASP